MTEKSAGKSRPHRAVSGRAVRSAPELATRTGRRPHEPIKIMTGNAIRGRAANDWQRRTLESKYGQLWLQLWFALGFVFFVFVYLKLSVASHSSTRIAASNDLRHFCDWHGRNPEFNL
jgi:hypothetical protein